MTISTKTCIYLFIPLLYLAGGCAKVSSPSGGPRDRTAPAIVKSIPENGARNFKDKKLVITFNEFVILEKINEKFMVSPPMSKKPEIYIRGKNLIVEFEDNLKDSTTYSFNFQDAIRDLNEGNIIDNYQFVFSTGRVIDSLSVSGNVFNALNLNIPENTLVLLYRNPADSAVIKQLPDYISRVDKNGSFRINNLREGKYRLYALKDIDNSKNYNAIEEEFAFLDTLVDVTPGKNYFPVVKDTLIVKSSIVPQGNPPVKPIIKPASKPFFKPPLKPAISEAADSTLKTPGYTLILFSAPKTAHYLTSSDRKMPYQLVYTLSIPPDSSNFEFSIPGTGNEAYFIENSTNRDTIRIWLTDSSLYSQPLITTIIKYPFTDSTGVVFNKEDTVRMRFMPPRPTRGVVKKVPLQIKNSMSTGILKPGQQIEFTSLTPLKKPDTTQIRLYETINEKRTKVPYALIRDTSNSCRYSMTAGLEEGKKYLFIADSATFGNIYGDYSDSTGIKFSVAESKAYGEIILNVKEVQIPLIIQLLDKGEKMIREKYITTDSKVSFPLLEKGPFRLKVIFDVNGDGRWTTGDFARGIQPEPASFYPDEIEVPTDWKVENDWIPKIKNFKAQKFREIKK